MGGINMKQPSKKELEELKKEALQKENWEKVEGFSVTHPTSIRLPEKMIHDLQYLAQLRGEKSYQKLLKNWVTDKVKYEMELVNLAKKKKTGTDN